MRATKAVLIATVFATLVAGTMPAVAGNKKGRSKERRPPVPAPANDRFATGTEIVEVPFGSTTDFTSASVEEFEPQPSCSSATATAWYRIAVNEDSNLVADATASFPTVITVFSGESLTDLSEVACAAGAEASSLAFPATAGQVYLFQVAGAKKHRGVVHFTVDVDTWKHQHLRHEQLGVTVPAVEKAVVVIDGQPRANNPRIYDVKLQVSDTTIGPFGVETDPFTLPGIHQEVAKVPGQEVKVTVTTGYRYDSAQRKCVLYQGEECMTGVPVSGSASWYANEGSKAEFVATVRIELNGHLISERTINVPFAGQVGGLLP
jgi:hypothetical protein